MTETAPRPLVAVLFGGRSSEHSVSCVTAAGVLSAIDTSRYHVLPIGITKDGVWRIVDDWADYRFDPANMPEVVDNGTEVIPPLSATSSPLLERGADGSFRELGTVAVYFPLLHGRYGEDGTLQGFFELTDTAFVGPGVFASAASMDKHYMKMILDRAGIPTCPWVTVTDVEWETAPEAVGAKVAELGYPAFVKPARAGSSMGISRVSNEAELAVAMKSALQHDHKIIVEPGIEGREIECSVLGSVHDAEVRTSLPGEIAVGGEHEFYDFEAKYLDLDAVQLSCPADIDEATTARVQDLAARTFQAFDCTGLTRVDTFVTPTGEVLVNELNTLPGFTPSSGYPYMWAQSGLPYVELVEELIRIALRDKQHAAS